MSHYKFSIITVVKNDEKNIIKTIKSVLKQKEVVDLEYIIIDGNSYDNTLKSIKNFKNEIDIILSESDDGIYDAMNKGMNMAKGDIVAFCNSGDILYDNGLLFVEKTFVKEKCDFVFGTVLRNYLGESILKHGLNEKRIYYNFDFATTHSCGFYLKKRVIEYIGNYNLAYKCSADYDLYYRLIKSKKFLGGFTKKNEIVGEVASGGFSSKLSFFEHLFEETKIRYNNNQNIFFICILFINASLKHLIKKFKKF